MKDLAHRYAAAVDARDYDAVAALFADDAVLAVPRPPEHLDPVVEHVGAAGVLEAMAALKGVRSTRHEVVDQVYDGTSGRITGLAHHFVERDGVVTDHVWHVHYLDDYVEMAEGWRFARREVHVDGIESHPV